MKYRAASRVIAGTSSHSWQVGDRARFLEGVYSLFAGAISQQTYSACEHRHGIQSTQCPTYFGFYLARLAVIDDELADDELHLLRLCPVAWFDPARETVFERMPTLYGDVSLRFRPTPNRSRLAISFTGNWRRARPRIVLHWPPRPVHASIHKRKGLFSAAANFTLNPYGQTQDSSFLRECSPQFQPFRHGRLMCP